MPLNYCKINYDMVFNSYLFARGEMAGRQEGNPVLSTILCHNVIL